MGLVSSLFYWWKYVFFLLVSLFTGGNSSRLCKCHIRSAWMPSARSAGAWVPRVPAWWPVELYWSAWKQHCIANLRSHCCWWFSSNQKSGIHSPVEGTVVGSLLVTSTIICKGFLYIQTVVVWDFFTSTTIGLVLVLFVCPIPPIQQATGESTLSNNTSSLPLTLQIQQ